MNELFYRMSPIYQKIDHRPNVTLYKAIDEERLQITPLDMYLYKYTSYMVLQCKVTTLKLHSGWDFNQITIEFALIWSVAEVNQVVLSLASILMAIYIYMYAIVHMHMCVLIEAIIWKPEQVKNSSF